MATNTLVKKLGSKPEQRVFLLDAPPGYKAELDGLLEGVGISEGLRPQSEVVQFFAATQADLGQNAPTALSAVKPGGSLWIGFPKGSSKIQTDLTRDVGWDFIRDAGWEFCRLISVDAVWSAWKFHRVSQENDEHPQF
jgi:hypothetical protein